MDLYKQPVDGIVHEAVEEEDLEHFSKGGEDVEREISDHIEENGTLTEGQAFVTGPGKLPCLKIIHVRRLKWQGGMENEDKALRETIENILLTAESNEIRSIAMPIMACTSKFRYPIDLASWILLQTIINLCSSKFQSIREVYICDTDGSYIHELQILAERQLGSYCLYIPNVQLDQRFGSNLERKRKEEYKTALKRSGIRTILLSGDRKFIIAWGDLARLSECTPPLQADIIVNPNTTFPLLTGRIADGLKAAARNRGGFDLGSECKEMEPSKGLKKGSFVATDTPNMSCSQILHLRIEGDQRVINEDILNGYIESCMPYALSRSVKSIAFPTIGTGNISYPRDLVAKCFIHTIAKISQGLTTEPLEKVIVVIYHWDMAYSQEIKVENEYSDGCAPIFTSKIKKNIDPGKRDFVLVKLISDTKLERDFLRHEPLEHPVIGELRQYDIKEIETKCAKVEVNVYISKKKKKFRGLSENVRVLNREALQVLKTDNIVLSYSQSISFDLETAFIQHHQKPCEFEEDGLKYCVDFSKFVEYQVDKDSSIVKVELIDLNNTDKEYSDVAANFRELSAIKRIQNRTLYQEYALKKILIQKQNTNLQNVEMTLWHGTAHEHTDLINRSGFNKSFAGQTHGTVWYGMGVYCSTRSEYGCGDVYTKRDANGHKYIYQCKVLTGISTTVTKGYNQRFPPYDSSTGKAFDSTSDGQKNEYVIFWCNYLSKPFFVTFSFISFVGV
ncbi:hypothetical protein ACJMK2_020993 [Sinanodonta woodiana]|uniref:Poly [ADP-ribose] polymerase n=1 Tax=Sinanodonta woodiana TaxID=1069815 RepID=A0ABD3U0V6_SINWO